MKIRLPFAKERQDGRACAHSLPGRLSLIGRYALPQHTRDEDRYAPPPVTLWRSWYTLKCCICLLLGRDERYKRNRREGKFVLEADSVCVAAWGKQAYAPPGDDTTYSWTELQVGYAPEQWFYAVTRMWS